MSRETSEWLNTHTLIGMTDKRGTAWHYQAAMQGDKPNHYPGPIPIADVKRRLFGWQLETSPVQATLGGRTITDTTRTAVLRPPGALHPGDPGGILGVFSAHYRVHQYAAWLLDTVAALLDDSGLVIGSAGLLRDGGVAWVQVELPDTITTPQGVEFRPHLTSATSADGTLATGFTRGSRLVVCDNTLHAARRDRRATTVRIRHTSGSLSRYGEVRDALGIVWVETEDLTAEIRDLCDTPVTPRQWDAFLDELIPAPEEPGKAATIADHRREILTTLWDSDERVTPWKGTAWGVLMATNTYSQHVAKPRGKAATIAQRNMMGVLSGQRAAADANVLRVLDRVLAG